jgi:hypothetical protein
MAEISSKALKRASIPHAALEITVPTVAALEKFKIPLADTVSRFLFAHLSSRALSETVRESYAD